MNHLGYAALVGLIVGAGGTAGGALLSLLFKTTGKRLSAALMGISGGIMLAAVLFDMIPEAYEEAGLWPVLIGGVLGAFAIFLVTGLIPHRDAADLGANEVSSIRSESLVRSGLLLAAGVSIHNLPQGIAIGSGVASGFGLVLSALLLFHNIPEGMAMSIPLRIGGVSRGKILWIALLTALPTVIGALVGAAAAGVSPVFIGASTVFAGGAMLYLTLRELIPQAMEMHKSAATALFVLAGAGIGGLVVWLFG